jgi:hypothetical protein
MPIAAVSAVKWRPALWLDAFIDVADYQGFPHRLLRTRAGPTNRERSQRRVQALVLSFSPLIRVLHHLSYQFECLLQKAFRHSRHLL